MSKVFRSLDDNALALKMRETVLSEMGTRPEDFDKRVTCGQIVNFLEQYRTEDGYVELDAAQVDALADFIFRTAVGSTLALMASHGLIESRWDDELNEMVFSLPDSALEVSKEE